MNLKNGNAAGVDGVTAEMLKNGNECSAERLKMYKENSFFK